MDDYEELKQVFQVLAPKDQDDPELMLFYNNMRDRHIWLENEINWEDNGFIVKYIQWINRIDTSISPKPIHLHIYSNGGEVGAAFAIYNAIQSSRIPVYTYNEGICYSAAFLIFLGGTQRFASKYASWIAHEGYGNTGGSYRESKAAMKDYERTVLQMKRIISKNSRLSLSDIEHHFEEQQDWYIYPDEAYEYGILTEKVEEEKNNDTQNESSNNLQL